MMDWLDRMNKALAHIEDNLAQDIDYSTVAQIACCSTYHFQRIFSYMAGVPLSEYIRRRRLATAAFELQNSNVKVIDVGLKYGYDSPTAFTRAFQNMHGLSPNAARDRGVRVKAYPPISFHISIKGAVEMDYRIEQRNAFRVVGVKLRTTMENEESFQRVPVFWEETFRNGMFEVIAKLGNGEPKGVLGISTCCADLGENELDYYIASVTDQKTPPGTYEFTVPAATWAIFDCVGPMPAAIQELEKRIVTEWLPTSGYEYAQAPDIEVYSDGDTSSAEYKSEVWVPVVKKA